jgi:hypothetical protein
MSIVTLKRKSQIGSQSSTRNGNFSLNGKYTAQQNYVSSRRFGQTPTPRNRSICEGNPMDPAGLASFDAPLSISKSTISTRSQLRGKYRYVLRPYPYSSSKPNIDVPRFLVANNSSTEPSCEGFADGISTSSLFTRMLALRSGSTVRTPLP